MRLLNSANFLESDYRNGVELKKTLEQARTESTRIISAYIRHTYWKGAPSTRFQGLPLDGRPVYSNGVNPDEAWLTIVEGIVLILYCDMGQYKTA